MLDNSYVIANLENSLCVAWLAAGTRSAPGESIRKDLHRRTIQGQYVTVTKMDGYRPPGVMDNGRPPGILPNVGGRRDSGRPGSIASLDSIATVHSALETSYRYVFI